jgi:hypothetical protein
MSNWSYLPGVDQPGSNVRANGGAGANALSFRDALDANRVRAGDRVPSAEYPDGYLGTIQSRREDKILDKVKQRQNDRSYQRGVHKGERIDPSDYYWPDDINPQSGLEYQARGLRWTAKGNVVERLAHMGKTEMASPAEVAALRQQFGLQDNSTPALIDPIRQQRLANMMPSWR